MARILLVDDDPTTLDLVGRALATDQHEVIRCLDGQEAIQKLKAEPTAIDLLLSDIEMPGLDGIELAKQIAGTAPHVRILLMSGFDNGTNQVGSLDFRVAGFVTKPLSLDQIRAAVRSALA